MNILPALLTPLARRCAALLALTAAVAALRASPVITEFVASNSTGHVDEDGDYSDWIELHNPDATPVDLAQWSLTDTRTNLTKWKFPAVTLPAGGYLVVYASDKKRAQPDAPLHTNFKLGADGEYLALVQPDGTTVAHEFTPAFPSQYPDISYGWTQPADPAEPPQRGYFAAPTPGARNGGADTLAIVETIVFSHPSGPFSAPFSLTLAGAAAGQTIRYVAVAPSAAGASVAAPDANSPAYTGPLAIDHSVIVRAAAFSTDGTRRGLVTSAQFLLLDTATDKRLDTFASTMPLLVFDDHGLGELVKDGIDHPAWLYGFAPGSDGLAALTAPPAFASPATLSVRGATSSLFPKKSFKFTLLDERERDRPLPLLGLPAFTEWNLIGPWKYDTAFIRNALVYDLAGRLGRWAPRTRLVELFFNHNGGSLSANDYAGVYVLTDKLEVEPGRIELTELDSGDVAGQALTGGYVLRIDEDDPEKLSWKTSRGFPAADLSVVQVDSPKLAKLAPAQRTYIQTYIQDTEDALHADLAAGWSTRRYLDFIDRPSWVDAHLINVLVKNTDAFWRSFYFTKDRGGKLVAGPVWDFDRSLDSLDPRDNDPETWGLTKFTSQGFAVPYWEFGWWGPLAQDPDFVQAWIDRWQTLRRDAFSDVNLAAAVHNQADQVGSEAAARDAARWADNVNPHGSWDAEIGHIEDWLTRRARWIDTQFVAEPVVASAGPLLRVSPPAGAQLVYTLDGADPRVSGGALASSARTAAGELLFVPSSLLRVRSHRTSASPAPATPDSPWSALLAPDATAPEPAPYTLPGRSLTATAGDTLTLAPDVTLVGAFDYQWFLNGTAIAGATDATLALTPASASQSGQYTLRVYSAGAVVATGTFVVALQPAARLVNLSARATTGTGGDVLIGGFVVGGEGTKNYLVRAVGPTLRAQGLAAPLAAPELRVYRQDGSLLTANTGWGTSPDAAAIAEAARTVGAFALPEGSLDSAALLHLAPGIYTLHTNGVNGTTGVALSEIYALDEQSSPLNLSARARVQPGEGLLIGGLVITGRSTQRLLIRAVGPSLVPLGITAPLADPVLKILSGTTVIHTNDNWGDNANVADLTAVANRVGAFALGADTADAAVLVDLPPGVYTVLVEGKAADSGIALVEIYAAD